MNNAALKGSVYNVMIEKKDGVAVYNTRTGNLIRAFDDRASTILEALQDTKDIEKMDSNILNVLVDKGILVSDEIDEFAEMERMEIEAKYDGYLHLIILPTEECNFRCIYCYEQFWRGDMSKEVQEGLVNFVEKQIDGYDGLIVSWFGGEPLEAFDIIVYLSQKFIEICKRHKKVYNAGMSTNGYNLSVENLNILKKLHITEYQITIDGPAFIHDTQRVLRDGSGTFDVIINNLIQIKREVHSSALQFVLRTNWSRQLVTKFDEFYNFLIQNFEDDKRFIFFWQMIEDYGFIRNDEVKNIFCDESEHNMILKYGFHHLKKNYSHLMYKPVGSVCYAFKKNAYVVSSDGMIKKCTCDMEKKRNRFGNICNDIDVLKENEWLQMRKINRNSKCAQCIKRPICHNRSCYKMIGCPPHLRYLNEVLEKLSEDREEYIEI